MSKPYTIALPSQADPALERRTRILLNGVEMPGVVSLEPAHPSLGHRYILEIDADLFEVAPSASAVALLMHLDGDEGPLPG